MDKTTIDFIKSLPAEEITIEGKLATNTIKVNGMKLNPKKSLKVKDHSRTGFSWGWTGSGPAQMALAILMLYTDNEMASRFYYHFKFGWVAGLPQTDFKMKINLRKIMSDILSAEKSIV